MSMLFRPVETYLLYYTKLVKSTWAGVDSSQSVLREHRSTMMTVLLEILEEYSC